MAELFGFKIERLKSPSTDPRQNIVPPQAEDGTQTVPAGGFFASYGGFDATARNELDLIRRYREVSLHPECDLAIEDIISEAIVSNENQQSVQLDLSKIEYSDSIKKKIRDSFGEVLKLLNFDIKGHDIFRRWYVDGRLYYHKIIDKDSPRLGVSELRYIDPRKIKKIREIRKQRTDGMPSSFAFENKFQEYYIFNERGIHPSSTSNAGGLRIATDAITYCPSGLIDQQKNQVLSYLHKAIKPVNQLRMIEDAVVIYRIARAPERRIFYIDVGNLPKIKAEQYLRDVMARYRNKLIDLFGLTKMSALNSFLSMTAAVLFEVSHTTKKSVTPRLPCTSLKNGSIIFLNCALVNSSLNSNSWNLEAVEIAFSKTINNLLTFILSNADGVDNPVLSPNNTVPWPGKVTTGLILALYNSSLCVLAGLKASLTAPLITPLLKPAGENQESAIISVLAANPAISPFNGTYLNTSLYLS